MPKKEKNILQKILPPPEKRGFSLMVVSFVLVVGLGFLYMLRRWQRWGGRSGRYTSNTVNDLNFIDVGRYHPE